MEYNTALFGEKRSVMTTVNGTELRQFDIATQNISVQQGYDSGDFIPNTILPSDLRLWEIGEESVLTKLSWYQMINGTYSQWDSTDNKRVPMILSTARVKTSSPAFDVQPTGTAYDLGSQCNYRNLISSAGVRPDAQYPLWYLQAPILTGSAPHFSTLPFILDFNYAGVLVVIYVKTSTNTFTLKEFIDNNNNGATINEVALEFYYGDETHKINTNANHLEGGTASQLYDLTGGCIINSKDYDVPTEIKSKLNYALDEVQLASRLQSQSLDSFGRQYPLISCMTPTTSLRCSIFKDREHLDEYGHLIQHGNGKYSDEDFDWILKQVALLGFWFTADNTDIANRVTGENCTDPSTYLPEIKDGITTGNYWAGTEAAAQDAAKWGDDWREKVNYDPSGGGGGGGDKPKPTPDPNPIQLQTPGFSLAVDNGSVCYTIDKAEWRRIWDDIYGGSKKNWKQLIEGLSLYGANPLNAILNYRWYPFEIAGTTQQPIRLGATTVKPESHTYLIINNTSSALISSNIAEFWIGENSNFMWTKKTKCRIFLPFYGYYELPMSQVMAKTVGVQFQYNLPDDTGVWAIYFDNHLYDYVECTPFIEIPITGDNSLQIASAKAQRNLSIAMTVGTAVAGALVGGYAGLAKGVIASGFGTAADVAEQGILGTIGALSRDAFYPQIGMAAGGALAGAAVPLAGGGIKTANTVMQSALQIGNLSTNVPVHSSGSDTTFLHLPMQPFIEFFTNNLIEDYSESQYKLKVGIACDMWKATSAMPNDTLLAATGTADMDTSGMTLAEIQELNQILQSGFYK